MVFDSSPIKHYPGHDFYEGSSGLLTPISYSTGKTIQHRKQSWTDPKNKSWLRSGEATNLMATTTKTNPFAFLHFLYPTILLQNIDEKERLDIVANVRLPTTLWRASASHNVPERNERMRVERWPKKEPQATDERGQCCYMLYAAIFNLSHFFVLFNP